ncbi:MAG TPA: GAF domain-containing protein [Lautropia sp.]|nr:GAF domain-containing protein [Lautropia sp.]
MTVDLTDLHACFEGVIPSIIATASPDGTPNISYLSHVVMVDDSHVGLSNQFFSKTASNIRENPQAALLLVDPRDGEQYRLDMTFVQALASGDVFHHVESQLQATSAQVGMTGVFRLKGVDIYRVGSIARVPSPVDASDGTGPAGAAGASSPIWVSKAGLKQAADVIKAVAGQSEVDAVVDTVLERMEACLGYGATILLLHDAARNVLTTLGSRGYAQTGVGSEVPVGEGIIGAAAAGRRLMKVSDMSRVRRFGEAIRSTSSDENRTRTINLPGMADSMSQIAVPMIAQGMLQGVLFAESRARLAFTGDDEAALSVIAAQTAGALVMAEILAGEPQGGADVAPSQWVGGRSFRVAHHAYDDSVFIGNEYVIKGVSGRLLMFMLEIYLREGRRDFTNRELRLAASLRLPDIKDNLESRLLLLRRRLADKGFPIRLVRTGRGRISLEIDGRPEVEGCA